MFIRLVRHVYIRTSWVKTDVRRFPRAEIRMAGGELEIADVLSLFHTGAKKADAVAFTRLMQHIKQVDGKQGTVLMVQVENEVELMGDSRDRSPAADETFAKSVPKDLISMLKKEWSELNDAIKANHVSFKIAKITNESSWQEVFGVSRQTDELFMAYHYALYVEEVAAAGKGQYALPLYTNFAQKYVGDVVDFGKFTLGRSIDCVAFKMSAKRLTHSSHPVRPGMHTNMSPFIQVLEGVYGETWEYLEGRIRQEECVFDEGYGWVWREAGNDRVLEHRRHGLVLFFYVRALFGFHVVAAG